MGLAPGLHGANKTGRPFTGDYAGELLYSTLLNQGLVRGEYERRSDDSLRLVDCTITNAVRCVPPDNKPTSSEITTCRQFLVSQIAAMPNLKAILSLGQIAHDSICRALGIARKDHPFSHGAMHETKTLALISSYHCSRYNTNTGVLTADMFERVVRLAKEAAQT